MVQADLKPNAWTYPTKVADGQVGNVCFAEGLVAFRGEWLLYVGLADSRLGVSVAQMA